MGVYIPKMEKPTDCDYCDFYRWGYCHVKHARVECADGVDDDCPLIEVTEPHGRLIDAGKLDAYKLPIEKQESSEWHKHSAAYKYAAPVFNGALDMVKDHAPTVIEAEGE